MGQAAVLAFPRGDQRWALGSALKRHRLPELLAAQLLREAGKFPDATAALGLALENRMRTAPINFDKARGILLVGASGAGKSAVAAKIMRNAQLMGRRTELVRADGGLALFRSRTPEPGLLTLMEADGFHPLNVRAAAAFSALGDIDGVETIGVVSGLGDAEDVCDIVSAFRFRRVIVTNLDRTRRLGALLAAVTGGAAIAHVTQGPRPEDALETLAPHALAAMLLDSVAH